MSVFLFFYIYKLSNKGKKVRDETKYNKQQAVLELCVLDANRVNF